LRVRQVARLVPSPNGILDIASGSLNASTASETGFSAPAIGCSLGIANSKIDRK